MAGRQLSHRNEGSATLGPTRTRISQQGLVAAGVAAVAFLSYYATLVPGLDLGDSASFQTGVGSLTLIPRHAYPLYHGLGSLFVWLHPGEPARAVNLASAVYGAVAAGLAVLLAARIAESLVAGLAAGLFLAFSYTYWTQAITAEVYTLHLLVVGAASLALIEWADTPTVGRLALFYALYALGFGNHLSMVLLLPAFALCILMHRKSGPSDPLRPRMLLMAIGIAAAGALQYAWNFRGLWADLQPPQSLREALALFWFDVTKADWRETLVNTVSETGLQHRPAMYWFDVQQQFGKPGVVLAAIGAGYVLWRWPRRGIFLLLAYAANMAFAWTYNVGDAYIFFLPSHYVVALSAGAGIAAIVAASARVSGRHVATALGTALVVYPVWRGYDTFPAVDRSWDRRAEQLIGELTADIAEDTVLGLDTNWQVQNALEYYMRERKPTIAWFTTDQLEWLSEGDGPSRFRDFVNRNSATGRTVVATERTIRNVYQSDSPMPSRTGHSENFGTRVESIPRGTPYVLAFLRSDPEFSESMKREFTDAWSWLCPGVGIPDLRNYTVIVGRVGEPPALVRSEDRPSRTGVRLDAFDIDIRMESWLPTDTIRRAGFGHVIVNRRHALTLERGLSFVALPPHGEAFYGSGLFAPVPKHLIQLLPNPQSLVPNP